MKLTWIYFSCMSVAAVNVQSVSDHVPCYSSFTMRCFMSGKCRNLCEWRRPSVKGVAHRQNVQMAFWVWSWNAEHFDELFCCWISLRNVFRNCGAGTQIIWAWLEGVDSWSCIALLLKHLNLSFVWLSKVSRRATLLRDMFVWFRLGHFKLSCALIEKCQLVICLMQSHATFDASVCCFFLVSVF